MSLETNTLNSVPTHIITGFLGVGKTTAILNLLSQKPADEKWAVLVNEFGEIGVDGSILEGQNLAKDEIAVKEVPGGCMCCASGLPMQIALNQLIAFAKPNRLFIEPTGLGHPLEVVEALSAEQYKNVLDLRRLVTLVDARKTHDERYTNHPTFREQLSIADLIVANKSDLYQPKDVKQLERFLAEMSKDKTQLIQTENGRVNFEDIIAPSKFNQQQPDSHHHDHQHHQEPAKLASDETIPDTGYLSSVNEGEGFKSIGWRFDSKLLFSRQRLLSWFHSLDVERLKAVFITDEGLFAYNMVDATLTESVIDETLESRAEIIAKQYESNWESSLLDCRSVSDTV